MSASIPVSTLEKFTTFGDLLRFLRRLAGITQMELAIAVGYSDAQISRLEQNLRLPDLPTIEARFIPALYLEREPKAAARLLELAANVRREDAPGIGLCPYKGLNYFDEADSDNFVGRESLTARLMDCLFSSTLGGPADEMRFLAVVGASGSGKSSLVRAGLVPALRWNKSSAHWNIHLLTPTAHPLESLASSLTGENDSVSATATLMDDLMRDSRSLQIFAKRKLKPANSDRLLLIIDQFEELFTLCRSEEEKSAFISNLLTAASEADGPVIVLITLRADFYAHCSNYIQLREALAKNQEYIGEMNDEELRRAIEDPARRGRWEFESGLVDLLLHDVGHEPGALPLLSHALLETWQRRRGRVMTLSGYTSSGGVRGAIAETAEAVFTDQFTSEQKEIARRIFLRLTELGDETATGDTRRRAAFGELILKPGDEVATRSVIKILADARLITTNEETVEVAHEALIREWPTLRNWLEENREGLRLHRHLSDSAMEWESANREPDMLYRGPRLIQTQEWALTHDEELNELEREFLTASIKSREQEVNDREAQRQRELKTAQRLAESESRRAEEQAHNAMQLNRRARYLTVAFVIALLMAITALFFGSQARRIAVTAENDRRTATARELAAASLNNLTVNPERSILLALQSVSTTRNVDRTVLPESLDALHQAIISSPIRMTLDGHGTGVLSANYSPGGSQLATIGNDGTVILWDVSTGAEQFRLPGITEPNDFVSTKRIAYSSDGTLLVACDKNLVKIYGSTSGNIIKTLDGHETDVTSVAISTDGKLIASGDLDGKVIIWNTASGDPLLNLPGHTDAIETVTFSPDGRWLVTAGDDAAMKIWDTASGDLLQNYAKFEGVVGGLAFSPDGRKLAFSDGTIHVWQFNVDSGKISNQELFTIPSAVSDVFSADGSQMAGISGSDIKIWDAVTGREIYTLVGHTDWVMGVAFSPNGKTLASTSLDGTVKTWSLSTGNEGVFVAGPGAGFGVRVAFNPNGSKFVTNGGDGTATIWNTETGAPRLILSGHKLEVLSVAFSSDGTRITTGGLDGRVIVWNALNGKKLFDFLAHKPGVRDIAFSPQGDFIATGGFDGTAKVWELKTGELIHEITGHQGLVLGVAFSPNGTRLATSSTDTTVKIWDVKTGGLLLTFDRQKSGVRDIVYSSDGSMIASGGGDGVVIVWDAATGEVKWNLAGHTSGIQSVNFSADGKLLASGSEDNTAKIWDVATGQEILSLQGSKGGVNGAVFSPMEGKSLLAVSSPNGVVRIFLLQIDELLALAQSRVTRPLTAGECQKYLHVDQCPSSGK